MYCQQNFNLKQVFLTWFRVSLSAINWQVNFRFGAYYSMISLVYGGVSKTISIHVLISLFTPSFHALPHFLSRVYAKKSW